MPAIFGSQFPPEYPFPGTRPASTDSNPISPSIPVVYEGTEPEGMSLRAYAAIQLRVPDSQIDWLDDMIRRSRELDADARGK